MTQLLLLSFPQIITPLFACLVETRASQVSKSLLSVPDQVLGHLLVSSILLYYHSAQVQNTTNIFLITNEFPAPKWLISNIFFLSSFSNQQKFIERAMLKYLATASAVIPGLYYMHRNPHHQREKKMELFNIP